MLHATEGRETEPVAPTISWRVSLYVSRKMADDPTLGSLRKILSPTMYKAQRNGGDSLSARPPFSFIISSL
jgi:hypothetical protein